MQETTSPKKLRRSDKRRQKRRQREKQEEEQRKHKQRRRGKMRRKQPHPHSDAIGSTLAEMVHADT